MSGDGADGAGTVNYVSLREGFAQRGIHMSEGEAAFLDAMIVAARTGNNRKVVELLEGGHPINEFERDCLAEYFKGTFHLPKRRGRRTPESVVRAARVVEEVKQAFRRHGYRIRRNRRNEAAIACAFAYLQHHGYPLPDEESLRNYLRRPKRLRQK